MNSFKDRFEARAKALGPEKIYDPGAKIVDVPQNVKEKYKSENVKFYCDNAADFDYKKLYDCIIIYNAFPHFDEPLRLFEHLTRHLRKGGTLTVCHGMSREKIIAHHENVSHVSHLLPEADELKEMMGKYLRVVSVISDEKMYLVSGIKE